MAEVLGRNELRAIARDGLVLPRAPHPGQTWRPTTPVERHLVGEIRRHDGHRQRLLCGIARMQLDAKRLRDRIARLEEEVGSLHAEGKTLRKSIRALIADRGGDTRLLGELTAMDLDALNAAAAGETATQTMSRLGLSRSAVHSRRRHAARRIGASTFHQALAMAAAAGIVTNAAGGGS